MPQSGYVRRSFPLCGFGVIFHVISTFRVLSELDFVHFPLGSEAFSVARKPFSRLPKEKYKVKLIPLVTEESCQGDTISERGVSHIQLQKQLSIPERSTYFEAEPLIEQRLSRQVFWLADGRRDTRRIAVLLHRPLSIIEEITLELQRAGYISLRSERKVLVMSLTLLKESFDMVAPQKEAFARSFYQRLFIDCPQTQPLFAKTDMRRQERSLMATLAAVITGVQRGDDLVPTLRKLGQRHKTYGAQAEHYPLVGAALLETFHQYLGPRFTSEMQEAWEEAFEIISTQMVEGANMSAVQ